MSSLPLGSGIKPCRSMNKANESSVNNDKLCAAPRVSIHRTHGPVGVPSAAIGITLMYWLVTATATIGGVGHAASRVERVASTMALHISLGSCSAPPPAMNRVVTGRLDHPTVVPSAATSATFGPPVPRSIANTHSVVTRRG